MSQRAAHLRLSGIVNGNPPQAVVEDQRRNKTLYVEAGGRIDEMLVETVSEDKITLTYDGERLDLAL